MSTKELQLLDFDSLKGESGKSPVISLEETTSGVMIDIQNADGTNTVAYVMNGRDGDKGDAGDPLSVLEAYPVGAIYISTVSTSPASLFGGTWTQIQNRFLLAAGSSYTAGATGGAKTVTLTEEQLPTFSPGMYVENSGGTISMSAWAGYIKSGCWGQVQSDTTSGYSSLAIKPIGSGSSINKMPPYLVVYVWKRTA